MLIVDDDPGISSRLTSGSEGYDIDTENCRVQTLVQFNKILSPANILAQGLPTENVYLSMGSRLNTAYGM